MQKLVKTQKSTNNLMSIFGLIEENMELSHIHLAVTNTIQKVQGSPIVFTTIEKDKKYFINPLYIFISLTMTCHYCIG